MAAGFSMVDAARDRWFARPGCPAASLIEGIRRRGKMRDAQVDAIKTYLFLKMACDNKPLWRLYSEGAFNALSPEIVDDMELPGALRRAMMGDPGMCAVYEYLNGAEIEGTALIDVLKDAPEFLDPKAFFHELFYGVDYTDYLFSLPMGAGKTYLMAAFIYLDLYFHLTDPDNAAFARNFVVFAPSGLKSSVVPSLRTIERFDPAWLFDDCVAMQLRSLLTFEVLDERKSAKASNRVKNPNVQKIAVHQPYDSCVGLVLVTNAEKVILDKVVIDDSGDLVLGEEPDEKTKVANELRRELGKLPGLAVIIDEVHHAQSDDIKLRAVVNGWVADGGDVNCILGFSGTPYLPRKKKVEIAGGAGFKTGMIANTVFYYPLVDGVANFLKRPKVNIVQGASDDIIRAGVNEFFDRYGDAVYGDGTCAKLAVFCSSVSRLEEEVYPLVAQLVGQRGLDASDVVLKYHRGGASADKSKRYPVPQEASLEFAALDTPISRKRVVLLVQIGKEGWDCRSLTGVVLSQEGDCAKSSVLQTSCRCLRQVCDASQESALIVVNQGNAKHLESQLRETQRTDLSSFQTGRPQPCVARHSRLGVLDLPPIEYRRFELSRSMVEEAPVLDDAREAMGRIVEACCSDVAVERVDDFDFDGIRRRESVDTAYCQSRLPVTFSRWVRLLRIECGACPEALSVYAQTSEGASALRFVFERVTFSDEEGHRFYRADCDQEAVRSAIRALFYPRRSVHVSLEDAGEVAYAQMVDERKLIPAYGIERERFYPDERREEQVLAADSGDVPPEVKAIVEQLSSLGQRDAADAYARKYGCKDKVTDTYQYIPYKFDSPFEQWFYEYAMGLEELREHFGLEVYYNGDRSVSDFRIDCFERRGLSWRKVGKYTPDFLIVQRKGGSIGKTFMIETKGAGFRNDEGFAARRAYIEGSFVPRNAEAFGEERFHYLVISDDEGEQRLKTRFENAICEFFAE